MVRKGTLHVGCSSIALKISDSTLLNGIVCESTIDDKLVFFRCVLALTNDRQ